MTLWDAIREDHRKVEGLFEKLQAETEEDEALITELRNELEAHAQGEEKAVYPELRNIEGLQDLVSHSLEEHTEVRQLLKKIEDADEEDEREELIEELRSAVEDHVEEEEEELLPVAEKQIPKEKAEEMLRAFQSAKKAALAG